VKLQKISNIFYQIFKNSWYFRIWVFFWIVCALAGFSCLIILGGRARINYNEKDVRTWIENATSIAFPQFHFRTTGTELITSCTCSHQNTVLSGMQCQPFNGVIPPLSQCTAIDSSKVLAVQSESHSYGDLSNSRIHCTIWTDGSSGNTLIDFGIEGKNVAYYGGNSYSGIWFAANDHTWIMLQKAIYKPGHGEATTEWNRNLLYHSTLQQTGLYNVSVIMSSFSVQHWEQIDAYNGWMGLGDIGGFVFFMLILHAILMIIIGFFMNNDSTFLNKGEEVRDEGKSTLLHS